MNRIQRKRTKGFKLPPNTLVITRGTRWGNIHKIEKRAGYWCVWDNNQWYAQISEESAIKVAVRMFERDLTPEIEFEFITHCKKHGIENIACFCAVDAPCHGDVWLEVWNEYQKQIQNDS